MKTPPIYGLDFLTTATGDSIDPASDQILSIGIATSAGTELYDGDEAELLDLVDRRLGVLPAGILATWFGSLIGFPLLQARAAHLGVVLQLNVAPDRRSEPAGPFKGLEHPLMVNWRGHQHFDLRRSYSDRSGRRSLAGRRTMTEQAPAAADMSTNNPEQSSDLIRQMTERRWAQSKRHVDRVPVANNPVGSQQVDKEFSLR